MKSNSYKKPKSAVNNRNVFFGLNLTNRHFSTTRTLGGLAIVVIALVSLYGVGTASQDNEVQEGEPASIPVDAVSVKSVDFYETKRTYAGMIKARRSSNLSFERVARLVHVHVQDGQAIQEGDILAELDSRNLSSKLKETTAKHDQAVAVLKELEAGPRKETIEAAKSEVKALYSQLQLQQSNHLRSKQLRANNVISQAEYDQTAFGVQTAQAQMERAQRILDELLAGTRAEQIEAQKAVVESLNASLQDLRIDIEDSILRAPYQGRITERLVDEGAMVSPGLPVMKLIENVALEAWIGLPVEAIQEMQLQQEYPITIEGRSYQAVLKTKLPHLDQATRTQTAIFTLNQEDSQNLVPGQIARVEFRQESQSTGFWLPIQALSAGSRGLWSVYVKTQNDRGTDVALRRYVEILHTDGDRVFVRGTLVDNDKVIVNGSHRIVHGQRIAQTK